MVPEILESAELLFGGCWPGAGYIDLDATDRGTERRAASIAAETGEHSGILAVLLEHGASLLGGGRQRALRSLLGRVSWRSQAAGTVQTLVRVHLPPRPPTKHLQWHLAVFAALLQRLPRQHDESHRPGRAVWLEGCRT